VSFVTVDQSRVFANNLALFIQHHLSRHGALASVARILDVEPAKLRRYARRRASDRELRDIEFVYQLVDALDFDPITVFSAAERSESLAMMLALAEGSIAHSLSVEFQGLTSAQVAPPRGHAIGERGSEHFRDVDADVA
jgi:hypothetical protein